MTSAADVARLAQVSRSAVSNYFNRPDLVSENAAHRIQSAVGRLNYVPNEAARRLRRGRNESIGVVLLDAWQPFFAEVSRGVEHEADRRGWTVQFSNSGRSKERERRHLELYEAQMTQGVIVFPGWDVSQQLLRLCQRGISAVLLDPPHARRTRPLIPSVAVDHVAGGRVAAHHLLADDPRQLAFVGNAHRVQHVADRLEGLKSVLDTEAPHLPLREIRVEGHEFDDGLAGAEAILGLDPAHRPDAVFAANDLVAIGLVRRLLAAGIRVPEDIRILGYDDLPIASQVGVPLTTVRQPARQIGEQAVSLVVDGMEGLSDEHIVLKPELVVRDSA